MLILFVLTAQTVCSKQQLHRRNKQKTTGYPCCITDQFTLSYAGAVGYEYDDDIFQGMRVFVDAAFDFVNYKFGRDVTFYRPEYDYYEKYKIYDLVNQDARYVVDDYGYCYMTYQEPETPLQCVPDGAMYDKYFYIGDQDMYLDSWKMRGTSFYGDMSISVTYDCVPVFANAAGNVGYQESFVSDGAFMNFTDTIYDRDYWFVPPPSCYNANATKIKSLSSLKSLRLLELIKKTTLFL